MPQHKVQYEIPAGTVLNKDAEFSIWGDGQLVGRLRISRGSIDWYPAKNTVNVFALRWERFDEIMRQYGTRKRMA